MVRVTLVYTDEDFKRMEQRAFINSRTIGEYIRRVIDYPCDAFVDWEVVSDTPGIPDPVLEPLGAEKDETTEVAVTKKPRRKKRKYTRKVKA